MRSECEALVNCYELIVISYGYELLLLCYWLTHLCCHKEMGHDLPEDLSCERWSKAVEGCCRTDADNGYALVLKTYVSKKGSVSLMHPSISSICQWELKMSMN